MLEISNFTKTYAGSGNVPAVDNLTLHVEKGDLFAFIGHNGAGKTTLLKACVGIDPIQQGEIVVDGINMKINPIEAKMKMAYIPDNPDVYEYLTGIQYLEFIGDMYQVPWEARKTNIEYYSNLLKLKENLGDLISTYSHGMKQKLVMISAFIHQPRVMLLDEPFVGLDPTVSHLVRELMKYYCSLGNSIFFSTHVLEVAEKLCNKVAIIKNGKLLASGIMSEVKGNTSLEEVFLELNPHE